MVLVLRGAAAISAAGAAVSVFRSVNLRLGGTSPGVAVSVALLPGVVDLGSLDWESLDFAAMVRGVEHVNSALGVRIAHVVRWCIWRRVEMRTYRGKEAAGFLLYHSDTLDAWLPNENGTGWHLPATPGRCLLLGLQKDAQPRCSRTRAMRCLPLPLTLFGHSSPRAS